MDDHERSPYQHVLLATDEFGQYQGHLYYYLYPTDSSLYCIGIRARPDKYISTLRSPSIRVPLIQELIKIAKVCQKQAVIVCYPRDNMISTFETLGFMLCPNVKVDHLKSNIIPPFSPREPDACMSYVLDK
jgi:hypothetical protein